MVFSVLHSGRCNCLRLFFKVLSFGNILFRVLEYCSIFYNLFFDCGIFGLLFSVPDSGDHEIGAKSIHV